MLMTRLGFLKSMFVGVATVAVAASAKPKAAVPKPAAPKPRSADFDATMKRAAEAFDPFVQSSLNGRWVWTNPGTPGVLGAGRFEIDPPRASMIASRRRA